MPSQLPQLNKELLSVEDPTGLSEFSSGAAQSSLGKTFTDFAKLVASTDAYQAPPDEEIKAQLREKVKGDPEFQAAFLQWPQEQRDQWVQEKILEERSVWNIENRTRSLAAIKGIESGAHYSPEDLTLERQRAAITEGMTPWKFEPDHIIRKIAQDVGGERGLQLYKAATLTMSREDIEQRLLGDKAQRLALKQQIIDDLGGPEKAALVPKEEKQRRLKNLVEDKISAAYEGLLAPEEKDLWNRYRKEQYGAPRDWRERGLLGVAEKVLQVPGQVATGAVAGFADALREKTEKLNPELRDNAFIRAGTAINRVAEEAVSEGATQIRGSADATILPDDSWKSPSLAAASAMGRAAAAAGVEALSLPFRAYGAALQAVGGGRIAGIDPGVALATAVDITDVDSRVAALKNAGKNMWAMLGGNSTDKESVFGYFLKVREGYKAAAAKQTDDPERQDALAKELMDRDVASLAINNPYEAQLIAEFAGDPSGITTKPLFKAVGAGASLVGKGIKKVAPEFTDVLHTAFSTAPKNEAAIMAEAEKLGVDPIALRNEMAVNQLRADKKGMDVAEQLQPPAAMKVSAGAEKYAFDVREGTMSLSEVPKKYQEEVTRAIGDEGIAKWEQTHQQIRETTKIGERYVGGELVPATERMIDPKTYVPHMLSEKKWYNPLKDVETSPTKYELTDFTAKSEMERSGTMVPMKDMYKQTLKAAQINGESVKYKERIAGLLEGASKRGMLAAAKLDDAPQVINEMRAMYPGTEWIAISPTKIKDVPMRGGEDLMSGQKWTGKGFEAAEAGVPTSNFQTLTPGSTVWDEASTLIGTQRKSEAVAAAEEDLRVAMANPELARTMKDMGYDVVKEHQAAVKAAQAAKVKKLSDDTALIVPKEYGQHLLDVGRLTVRGGTSDAIFEYMGALARKARPFMNAWRIGMTMARGLPYAMRNASAALVLPSVAAGVKVFKPATARTNLQIALLSVAQNEERARKVALTLEDGAEVSLGQIHDVLDKAGFLGQGVARQGLTDSPIGKKIMEHTLAGTPIPVWGRGKQASTAALNSTIENYQKVAAFSGLIKKWTPEGINEALYATKLLAGHMNNLTRFETTFMREGIPFYAWQKYIIPAMARGAARNPQIFAGYIRARGYYDKKNATKYAPYEQRALPKWAQSFQLVSGKQPESPDQGLALTSYDDPFTMGAWLLPVIEQLGVSREVPGGDAAKGNLGPLPILAYELMGGVDWETGTPIQGQSVEDLAYLWGGLGGDGKEMQTAKKLVNLYNAGHPLVKMLLSPLEPMGQDLAAAANVWRDYGRPEGEIDVKMRYLAARRLPLISAVVDLLRRIEGQQDYSMGREIPGVTTTLAPSAEETMAREQRALLGKAKGIYKQTSKELFK